MGAGVTGKTYCWSNWHCKPISLSYLLSATARIKSRAGRGDASVAVAFNINLGFIITERRTQDVF